MITWLNGRILTFPDIDSVFDINKKWDKVLLDFIETQYTAAYGDIATVSEETGKCISYDAVQLPAHKDNEYARIRLYLSDCFDEYDLCFHDNKEIADFIKAEYLSFTKMYSSEDLEDMFSDYIEIMNYISKNY